MKDGVKLKRHVAERLSHPPSKYSIIRKDNQEIPISKVSQLIPFIRQLRDADEVLEYAHLARRVDLRFRISRGTVYGGMPNRRRGLPKVGGLPAVKKLHDGGWKLTWLASVWQDQQSRPVILIEKISNAKEFWGPRDHRCPVGLRGRFAK